MVDRVSKLTKLIKVSKKNAPEMKEALMEKLDPVKKFVLTSTSDNGKEFSKPRKVSDFLQSEFYLPNRTTVGKEVLMSRLMVWQVGMFQNPSGWMK